VRSQGQEPLNTRTSGFILNKCSNKYFHGPIVEHRGDLDFRRPSLLNSSVECDANTAEPTDSRTLGALSRDTIVRNEVEFVARSILVFGTSHRLQGAACFPGTPVVAAPYSKLLRDMISSRSVDFVFEEASGMGPTTAQYLAGAIPYVDVDLSPNSSKRHDAGVESGSLGVPVDPTDPTMLQDFYSWEFVDRQAEREEFWLQRINEQEFASGLMICGFAHLLSFAFRLKATGFEVECLCYVPHPRLCDHHEAKSIDRPPQTRL
jgi:hypothetical protein